MTSIYLSVLFTAHEARSSRTFTARRRARDLRLLLGVSSGALAALLLQATPAVAGCSNATPGSGATVVCDANAPNPDTQGVQAQVGSTDVAVTVNPGASINAQYGIIVRDQSQVLVEGGGVVTAANVGVWVNNQSTVTNNGTIDVTSTTAGGDEGVGLKVVGSGAQLTNNGAITSAANFGRVGGIGAWGDNNTILNGAGATITTNGNDSNGMKVQGTGNTATNDGLIVTNGQGTGPGGTTPIGMDGNGFQNTVINNGTIRTLGTWGIGMYGAGADQGNLPGGDNTLINAGIIETAADNGIGMWMFGDTGTLNNSGTITTTGVGAFGVRIDGNTNTLTNTSTIATSGATAHGVFIIGDGNSVDNGSAISASGVGSDGINVFSAAGQNNGVINRAGATITGQNVAIQGGAGNETVDNAGTLTGNSGVAVNLSAGNDALTLRSTALVQGTMDAGTDTDTLNFDAFAYTGGSEIMNWESLNLANGSALTLNSDLVMGDAGSLTGTVNIDGASSINAFTDRTIRAIDPASDVAVNNAGTLNLSDGTVGNRLTVVGNYVGQGGRLVLDTVLDADGPSDVLVIDGGSATGNTSIVVNNAGGLGAATTGDGIQVVDAINNGITAPDAFALSGPVVAGAWNYDLFRGGVSDAEDWFLRTQAAPRAEVPPYVAVPNLPFIYGRNLIGSYRERFAEVAPAGPATVYCKDPAQNFQCPVSPEQDATYADGGIGHDRFGIWGRVLGTTGTHDQGSFADEGPSFDYDMAGIQAGMDLMRHADEDGDRDIAGLYVALGYVDADVDDPEGGEEGEASLDGYTVGAYWTHIGAAGWYLDAVAQWTWFDNIEASSANGIRIETDGWATTASLEAGYPVELGNDWALEPQAQIIWQHQELDDTTDIAAIVKWETSDSFLGRVGTRIVKSLDHAAIWGQASLLSAFGEDLETTLTNLQGDNPTTFKSSLGGTWAQVGLGASVQVAENAALFGSGDYSFSVDDGDSDAWSGRGGLKFTW